MDAASDPTSTLVARFVTAFKRGIEGEVTALQASSPVAEAALSRGESLGDSRYSFDVLARETLRCRYCMHAADAARRTTGNTRTCRRQPHHDCHCAAD